MNIDELTVKEYRELVEQISKVGVTAPVQTEHPYEIGKNYFIRTVTHHFTGELKQVTQQELVLEDVSWVADDGRFNEALKDGTLSEVEPYPSGQVIVGRGSLIDATVWLHDLPRDVK